MISIYIPRIDAAVTIEQIKNILENVFNLGTIQRIECKSNRRHEDFFYCFIFFNQWNVNHYADYILSRIQTNQPTRLFHEDIVYDWIIFKNISELSFYRDPIQMDLTLEIHSDIRYETVLSTIDSLDIGKVRSIEMMYANNNSRSQPWDLSNQLKINSVCIHFDYWYRTKAAYTFQKQIINDKYIQITVNQTVNRVNPKKISHHFWTFYPESPKFRGMNPNIWTLQSEDENVSSLTVESTNNPANSDDSLESTSKVKNDSVIA